MTGLHGQIAGLVLICQVMSGGSQTQPAEDNFLLVADGRANRIYQFYLNGTLTNSINMGRVTTVLAIDYDPILQKIFWSDIETYSLNVMDLDGSNKNVILQLTDASSPEGIALDPNLGLVFYTDSGLGRICVLKYSGADHRVIVTSLPKPRDVQLDRVNRFVYWTDWEDEVIKRCRYDGSEVLTVVQTIGSWFNGLALDVPARTMYYTDALNDHIMRANMDDGSNVTELATAAQFGGIALHPYGVVKVGNELFFTDWQLREIIRLDLQTGNVSELSRVTFLRLHGIVAYTSARYDNISMTTPCLVNNGGCSDLCLPLAGDTAFVCACPDGLDLGVDDRTCSPVDPNANGPDVIWVEHDDVNTGYVRGIKGDPTQLMQPDGVDTWSFRSPGSKWTAVDFSYERRLLFLVDQKTGSLYEMQLNNSLMVRRLHNGLSSQVFGVAYDWYIDAIYWADAMFNWIKVVSRGTPYAKTLVKGLDQPHGIVVNPKEGRMFWTDWGRSPQIESANLQGENRRVILTQNVNRPTGITCDFQNDLLYWADVDGVYSCTFEGEDVRFFEGSEVHSIADITYFNGFVVALGMGQGSAPELRLFNVRSPETQPQTKSLMRRPFGVTMYHVERQQKPDVWIWNDCIRCAQLCLTVDVTDVMCSCADGYETTDGGLTCRPSRHTVQPMFVYAAGNRMCRIRADSSLKDAVNPDTNCFFDNAQYDFRAMDYDYKHSLLYFADIRSQPRTIRRVDVNALSNNSIVVTGVGQVYGLALDWIADNLYWADFAMGHIWVSRPNGAFQKILLRGLNKPLALTLDMRRRQIFWSEPGKIRRASLDGSNVMDFITHNVANVTSLAMTYRSGFDDRLYWANSATNRVESVSYRGTDRQQAATYPGLTDVYGLAILEDLLAVTGVSGDTDTRALHVTGISEGESPARITHRLNYKLYDVVAFYGRNQLQNLDNGVSSCTLEMCDQLCLQNALTHYCACMDGMTYDEQQRQCVSNTIMTEEFLLIADDYRHTIYQVHPQNITQVSAIKVPELDRPLGLAYDHVTHTIFWTDFKTSRIKKTDLFSNSGRAPIIKRGEGRSRIDGLAVDILSRLVFYTDTGRHRVGVITYDGQYDKTLLTSLDSNMLQNPRAIVLDPTRGHLYFTVRYPDLGGIMRADVDGGNLVTILGDSSWPNGLDIDIPGSALYYVDGHSEVIGQIDLDGSNHSTLHVSSARADPFGVAKVGDYIYWTDWYHKGIFKLQKNTQRLEVVGGDFFLGLNDIVYFKSNQTQVLGLDFCTHHNGGCSDICLAMPGGAICACADDEDGNEVIPGDGRLCSVASCPTVVANGKFTKPCSFLPGAVCSYTCAPNFGKTERFALKCSDNLTWNKSRDGLCVDTVCPPLPLPSDAEWVGKDCSSAASGLGMLCTQRCMHGYQRANGSEQRQCLDSQQWSGYALQCERMYCDPVSEPAHGVVTPTDCTTTRQPVGSVCHYNCSDGYKLRGTPMRTCHHGRLWTDGATCEKQGSPSQAATKKSGESVAVPVAVGVLLTVFLIAALLLTAVCLLKKKNSKKGAKYRHSRQQGLQGSQPPRLPPEELNPSYDVRQGSVSLDGSRTFENPTYKNLNEVKEMKGNMKPIEEMDMGVEDGPLPDKIPVSEDDVTVEINANIGKEQLAYGYDVSVQDPNSYDIIPGDGSQFDVTNDQRTAFTNPMYDRVGGAPVLPVGEEATLEIDQQRKTASES